MKSKEKIGSESVIIIDKNKSKEKIGSESVIIIDKNKSKEIKDNQFI